MNAYRIAAVLAALSSVAAFALEPGSPADEVFLGSAPWLDPAAPAPFQAPVARSKVVVPVPALDTANRAAVKSAYNTYYNIAMPAVGFTGNVASCSPGSISLAFQEWTISRINFLRAMAGVRGNTTLDSSKNAQQQAASLIMAASNTLTHFPPNSMPCWSQAGAEGASSSNLSLGITDSIQLYMSEPGGGNEPVGHRRWILHTEKGSFGHGQVNAASALSTFDFSGGAAPAPNGIPWPPRGYTPLALFPTLFTSAQRWSFGLPGANFGAANVALTLNGVTVPITVVSRTDDGYGDNTIVWELPANHTVTKGTVYDVTISGVTSAASSSYNYQVRPFDPADPATDLNTDGKSDLLYRNSATGQVYRFLVDGFTLTSGAFVYTEPNTAWKIVSDADFNGDGIADLLWRNDVTGQVYLLNLGMNGFPAGGSLVVTESNAAWKIVHTPDLDGDGKADILWWNSSTGQVYAMIMNGGIITGQGFVYTEPNTAWKVAAVGDFAGSGKRNQLLWRNGSTGQVYLMTVTFSGGVFGQSGAQIYQEPNTAWKILGAADFNGNGNSDILWRNDVTGQVFIMLMNGGAIAGQGLVHTEPNLAWKIVAHGDYNGDGNADLLWRNDSTGQLYMMRMNGTSVSLQAPIYQEANTAWKVLGSWEYAQ